MNQGTLLLIFNTIPLRYRRYGLNLKQQNIMKAMKAFTTVTGRVIRVSSNKAKRTFTIVTDAARYRTSPMNKGEFEANLNNTGNDWQQFLNTGDYYKL